MENAALALLCGLMGAVAFRVRGGLLDNSVNGYGINIGGGQMSRLVFCFVSAITMLIAGEHRWWVLLLAIPAEFLGCIIGLWHSIDLGTVEDSFERDYPLLSLRGFVWTLPTLTVLALFGYGPLELYYLGLAGLLMGTLYWLAEYIPLKLKGLGKGGFTEIGEALTGFAFCFASYFVASGGYSCYWLSFFCFS